MSPQHRDFTGYRFFGGPENGVFHFEPPCPSGEFMSQFVLKLRQDCNLACDYCYVYEMADQSWRDRAREMSRDTLRHTAQRVGKHISVHEALDVQFIFHGGEPLLVSPDYLDEACTTLKEALPYWCKPSFLVQTNAIRLQNDKLLDVLNKHNVGVGVSIDGNQSANDRHRKYRTGRGSFADVRKGIEHMQARYPRLFRGILCTVTLDKEPLATYQALRELGAPAIDFLLPHGNWEQPPPERGPGSTGTPYADWLLTIYRHQEQERHARVGRAAEHIPAIRFLESMRRPGASQVETLGLDKSALVVIDTDGSYRQVDTLSSTYEGADETGYNVRDHTLEEIMRHPGIQARRIGLQALSTTCQECPLVATCGGGYYPHRYSKGNSPGTAEGFKNTSVYCPDLQVLIGEISVASDSTKT